MPVISIKSLPLQQEINISSVLTEICNAGAAALNYKPEHFWATWEFLQPGYYAVGGKTGDVTEQERFSPIVSILSFEGKPAAQIEILLKTIGKIIAERLNINADNVFIAYSEARSGQVYDGGKVVYAT